MRSIYLFAAICLAAFTTSCSKDIPQVSFPESSYMIPASGGEMIIPVLSTGVDDVRIEYSDHADWVVAENGDMTPSQGWIELIKVINDYQTTSRTLAQWTSGIVINVAPNTTKYQRSATISVNSSTASATMSITQPAPFVK